MDDLPESPQNSLEPGCATPLVSGRGYQLVAASPEGLPAHVRIVSGSRTRRFEIDPADGRRLIRAPAGTATLACDGPGSIRVLPVGVIAVKLATLGARARGLRTGGLRSIVTTARLAARGQFREILRRIWRQTGELSPPAMPLPADLPKRRPILGNPPRMAIVGPVPTAGGAQFCQYELAVGLRDRGIVEPVVFAPAEGALSTRYAEAGIECRTSGRPIEQMLDAADLSLAIEDLGKRLRNARIDIVFANTLSAFHAIEAGRREGIPCVLNPRESERDFFSDRSAVVESRALAAFEMANRVIFVAESTRQVWAEFDRGHFAVIQDALGPAAIRPGTIPKAQARATLGIGGDERLVLCVGTVTARKGQLDLIRAFARLDTGIARKLRVAIVGDRGGEYSKRCAAEIAALPDAQQARIRVVAETTDMADWYAAADIFALCSRYESYPRVILEAMAHGLAIVATPVYGVREQIRDRLDGLFYEPGDFRALGKILEDFAKDASLVARLSTQAGRRLAELPGFDAMITRYAREIDAAVTSSDSAVPASR